MRSSLYNKKGAGVKKVLFDFMEMNNVTSNVSHPEPSKTNEIILPTKKSPYTGKTQIDSSDMGGAVSS